MLLAWAMYVRSTTQIIILRWLAPSTMYTYVCYFGILILDNQIVAYGVHVPPLG